MTTFFQKELWCQVFFLFEKLCLKMFSNFFLVGKLYYVVQHFILSTFQSLSLREKMKSLKNSGRERKRWVSRIYLKNNYQIWCYNVPNVIQITSNNPLKVPNGSIRIKKHKNTLNRLIQSIQVNVNFKEATSKTNNYHTLVNLIYLQEGHDPSTPWA